MSGWNGASWNGGSSINHSIAGNFEQTQKTYSQPAAYGGQIGHPTANHAQRGGQRGAGGYQPSSGLFTSTLGGGQANINNNNSGPVVLDLDEGDIGEDLTPTLSQP